MLRRYWLGLYEGQARGRRGAGPAGPWHDAALRPAARRQRAHARLPLRPARDRLHAGLRHRRPDQPRLRRDRDGRRLSDLHRRHRARARSAPGTLPLALLAVLLLVAVVGAVHGLATERLVFRPLRAPALAGAADRDRRARDLPPGIPAPAPGLRRTAGSSRSSPTAHTLAGERRLRGHDQHLAAPDPRASRSRSTAASGC